MLFPHIQLIVSFVLQQLRCPHCNTGFMSDDIDITELDEEGVLLMVSCHECETDIEIDIALSEGEAIPNITINSNSPVTEDDVGKITQALADHKGSLKTFLKRLEHRDK